MYRCRGNCVRSLTYLKSSLRNRGQKDPSQPPRGLFRQDAHSLWRTVSSPTILQAPPITQAPSTRCPLPPTQQPLQCGRDAAGPDVSHDAGTGTHRGNPFASPQWGLPVPYRITDLSRSDRTTPLPVTHGALRAAEAPHGARPPAFTDGPIVCSHHALHLRPGFHGPRPLWKTGRGAHRLQPAQEGPSLVSPAAVLRGPYQRLLARGITPRGCPYGHRYPGPVGGVLCQTPASGPDRARPRRQRVLRSQDHRVAVRRYGGN